MTEIIPSINVPTFSEVQERIKKIEPYVSWCHLDVTDGVFSKHPTWRNPADLQWLETSINIEVHLMAEHPEKIIDQWIVKPVKRVIIHLEAVQEVDNIIDRCRKAGIECGLAIRPDTSWEFFMPWMGKVDLFQILAVNPGPTGQEMAENTVDKIAHLRMSCPSCIIEVDGGINKETAQKTRAAGADILVSAGYIFSDPDMRKAIKELQA